MARSAKSNSKVVKQKLDRIMHDQRLRSMSDGSLEMVRRIFVRLAAGVIAVGLLWLALGR